MPPVRYPILNSRIPADGGGRVLTRNERDKLCALGVRLPRKTRVLRSFGCDHIGWLVKPFGCGLTDAGICVTLAVRKEYPRARRSNGQWTRPNTNNHALVMRGGMK